MDELAIRDEEFSAFQDMFFREAGIRLAPGKKALVASRLARRVKHHGLKGYGEYFRLVQAHTAEQIVVVDLLTTNETYFFREPKHFDYLRTQILPRHGAQKFRVWSAACSSGEEPYTLAMVLADTLKKQDWEIFGSDLSTRMLEKACAGLYPLERGKGIPEALLKRYCWKGKGEQEGNFLIDDSLRAKASFAQINLNEPLPDIGLFDAIFLRNVLIYFEPEKKQQIVGRLLQHLRPGGHLFIGHSESLNGMSLSLTLLAPSIYRKR
jgi:chemotaxis protein methyltransferase CheR